MCGIFGKYSVNGVSTETLERMAAVLVHRGPDDVGFYADGMIGLGNRRLSIIDLKRGRQPITNEDATVWIVFNGEIYNYRELRERLKSQGHSFRTSTDTEVIVHLYEEEGEQCVEHLEGMFAFVIWDAPRRRLFCARDRIGQKPLYYHHRPGLFVFASEIKAILATEDVEPALDPLALHDYLSMRFVPPPRTMFRSIQKLPAAHTLTLEGDEIKVQRYWSLRYDPKIRIDEREAQEALGGILAEAVESHQIGDVPVGALLSGGLDSGLVVALMGQNNGQAVRTFSVGVTDDDWNELPFARAVSARYKTDHHEVVVQPDILEILPTLVWHLDEPSDPSATCKYYVARAAAEHVKVVLGGDGGDEMFGGYDRYVGNRLAGYYCKLPRTLRLALGRRLLTWVPDSYTYKSLASKLRWLNQMSEDREDRRYAASVNFFRFDAEAKQRLYTEKMAGEVSDIDSIDYIAGVFRSAPVSEVIDRMLYTDVTTQLAEHGLMIVDRTTMAFGLESRSPFLDRKVVEFSATLPANLKIRGHRIRYLQRKLARQYLPPEVARRRKQGFGLPLGSWFKGTLGTITEDLFAHSALVEAGHFRRDGLLAVLNEHRNLGIDHSHRLWMLLNLEMWYQIFINKNGKEKVAERLAAQRLQA